VAVQQLAHAVKRKQNKQVLDFVVQAVAADLSKIEIDVAINLLRDEFVASEGDVAEAALCIAGRVHVVVLDTSRCGNIHTGCLDEGGQGAGDAEPSARQLRLRKKDAVDQAADVVLEQHLGQLLAVDGSFLETTQLGPEMLNELSV